MDNENINIKNIVIDDTAYETFLTKKFVSKKKYSIPDTSKVFAVIPGIIREIFVRQGSPVKRGEPLLILEAMKMKNEIRADRSGIIKAVYAATDTNVAKGQILIEFE